MGAVVPWLKPGVGAVATQHHHEPRLAYEVLDELESGVAPKDAVERALNLRGQGTHLPLALTYYRTMSEGP